MRSSSNSHKVACIRFRKKNFVGEVKYSIFDNGINLHEKVYVATEQNVVAALSLDNGKSLELRRRDSTKLVLTRVFVYDV